MIIDSLARGAVAHARALLVVGVASVLLAGCAGMGRPAGERVSLGSITSFSASQAGAALPGGWQVWTLARFKKPTDYGLITKDGATVVEARADGSASGLLHSLNRLDAREFNRLSWRWKVEELIKNQDNTRSATEDAPVRLVIRFDGDRAKLDFSERLFASKVKAVTGEELPYATLMYIWGRATPRETVITSRHTERIRMIVAESGSEKVGAWQNVKRNLYEDFKRAYGEEPGPSTGIGIMTDTDNTGERTRAWYGDISLTRSMP